MTNSRRNDPQSLYDLETETAEGRQALAAAAAASRMGAVLERAFDLSGLTQKQLAEVLELTEGRVSQVLHGDGNVHIATAARFLDALDCRFAIGAVDRDGCEVLPGAAPRPRVGSSDVRSRLEITWTDGSLDQITPVTLMHKSSGLPSMSKIEYVSTLRGVGSWSAARETETYETAVRTAVVAEESHERVRSA